MLSRSFSVELRAWSAWSPGRATLADWKNWLSDPQFSQDAPPPRLSTLPPLFRRRCRRLSRAALSAALACTPFAADSQLPSVFASRYGETETTVTLLKSLAEHTALSPTSFSHSVHNTASGLFTIATGNRAPSTTVAAGQATFLMGLLESVLWLAREEHPEILFVVADEDLPAFYEPALDLDDRHPMYFACAMLLRRAN